MGRGGAGLIVLTAAALALAGCKSTDSRSSDKDTPGTAAARTKKKDDKDGKDGKGATWLDPVGKLPGADTSVPKAPSWSADPNSPNFNAKAESQDAVGGKVVDSFGRPAKNVFIRIEEVNAAAGKAPMGIYTDQGGYFFTRGLKPGKAYNLTAEASQEGKPLAGSVQTLVPNPVLTILLREDAGLPPPKGSDSGTFPPPPAPADGASDHIPPMGLEPVTGRSNPRRTPTDAAFSPDGGATRPVPATIGLPPGEPPQGGGGGTLPPPDDLSNPSRVTRPENVADGPRPPFTAPPVSIPGPPSLPPGYQPPAPGGGNPDPKQSRARPAGNFTLVDTLDRPWDFAANRSGSVVLVEFITTECVPCKRAIPVMTDLQARYATAGLQVLAVVCDDKSRPQRAAAAAKYARDNNLNYALYIEPGETAGGVRDQFDVKAYPTAVLLDAHGSVLWQGHPQQTTNTLDAAVKRALGR